MIVALGVIVRLSEDALRCDNRAFGPRRHYGIDVEWCERRVVQCKRGARLVLKKGLFRSELEEQVKSLVHNVNMTT